METAGRTAARDDFNLGAAAISPNYKSGRRVLVADTCSLKDGRRVHMP